MRSAWRRRKDDCFDRVHPGENTGKVALKDESLSAPSMTKDLLAISAPSRSEVEQLPCSRLAHNTKRRIQDSRHERSPSRSQERASKGAHPVLMRNIYRQTWQRRERQLGLGSTPLLLERASSSSSSSSVRRSTVQLTRCKWTICPPVGTCVATHLIPEVQSLPLVISLERKPGSS